MTGKPYAARSDRIICLADVSAVLTVSPRQSLRPQGADIALTFMFRLAIFFLARALCSPLVRRPTPQMRSMEALINFRPLQNLKRRHRTVGWGALLRVQPVSLSRSRALSRGQEQSQPDRGWRRPVLATFHRRHRYARLRSVTGRLPAAPRLDRFQATISSFSSVENVIAHEAGRHRPRPCPRLLSDFAWARASA